MHCRVMCGGVEIGVLGACEPFAIQSRDLSRLTTSAPSLI